LRETVADMSASYGWAGGPIAATLDPMDRDERRMVQLHESYDFATERAADYVRQGGILALPMSPGAPIFAPTAEQAERRRRWAALETKRHEMSTAIVDMIRARRWPTRS
jgi:hypothetical protein